MRVKRGPARASVGASRPHGKVSCVGPVRTLSDVKWDEVICPNGLGREGRVAAADMKRETRRTSGADGMHLGPEDAAGALTGERRSDAGVTETDRRSPIQVKSLLSVSATPACSSAYWYAGNNFQAYAPARARLALPTLGKHLRIPASPSTAERRQTRMLRLVAEAPEAPARPEAASPAVRRPSAAFRHSDAEACSKHHSCCQWSLAHRDRQCQLHQASAGRSVGGFSSFQVGMRHASATCPSF